MKHILMTLSALAAAAMLLGSCLSDDNTTSTSPECAITAFSVADIASDVVIQGSDGLDSTITRTIDGDAVYFNIDQLNNRITSVDSLASWADISQVLPTVTAYGTVYCRQGGDSIFYYFTSGSDSVDFTQKVEFLVVANDQSSSKIYTAEIFKASNNSDSLYWTEESNTVPRLDGRCRAVVLDNRIYVFAETDGRLTVTSADAAMSPLEWSEPSAVSGAEADLDWLSVTVFDGSLFALDVNGTLYRSTSLQEGKTWTKASDATFLRLLAADATYLYAFDGTRVLATADLENWEENGVRNLNMLPAAPVNYAAYTTKTNAALQNVVMLGLSDSDTTHAVVWFKVSAPDDEVDQDWAYVEVTADNAFGLPRLADVQMFRYAGTLYAFGGRDLNAASADEGLALAYVSVYASSDNGVTWHEQVADVGLPADLNASPEAQVSAVVAADKVWLLQSGGRVWRGSMISVAK